jgi:putative ABC transport system permease protein
MEEMEILDGRWYTVGEGRVAVLGTQLANSIGKTVGDTIELEGAEFEVVGIFRSFNVYENGSITLPLEEMQRLMASEGKVTGFALVLDDSVKQDEQKIQAVVDQINKIEHTEESGYKVSLSAMSAKDYVSNTLYIKIANAMAWMTSAIAIIVGSIGVLNTMIMSVVERVKEISILRAIGWKKSRVVRMILGEALILSIIGAALGIVTAIFLVKWLTTLPAVAGFIEGTIAGSVLGKGIVLALVVGILGGAYPAWRAAQLLPSEGLRHE